MMKRALVKRVVLSQRPDVLFSQETKCSEPMEGLVKFVWGQGSMGWIGKALEGASGGLWTVWNATKFKLTFVDVKQFSILTVSEEISSGRSFLYTNVYGPNLDVNRGLLFGGDCFK